MALRRLSTNDLQEAQYILGLIRADIKTNITSLTDNEDLLHARLTIKKRWEGIVQDLTKSSPQPEPSVAPPAATDNKTAATSKPAAASKGKEESK